MIVTFDLIEPDTTNPDSLLRDERQKAVLDIIHGNDFELVKYPDTKLKVTLSIDNGHLHFQFAAVDGTALPSLALSPRPYRKLVQDYFTMVESYETIRSEGNLYKLEAVDMARRAIHNEAAEMLTDRLKDKISMDFETARRLFTLICVLHLGQGKQLKSV